MRLSYTPIKTTELCDVDRQCDNNVRKAIYKIAYF